MVLLKRVSTLEDVCTRQIVLVAYMCVFVIALHACQWMHRGCFVAYGLMKREWKRE